MWFPPNNPSKEISNISARTYFLSEISENYVLQMGERQGTEWALRQPIISLNVSIHFAWSNILRYPQCFQQLYWFMVKIWMYILFCIYFPGTHTDRHPHTPSTLTLFIIISVFINLSNTESHWYLNCNFHRTAKIWEINPSTNQFCNLLFELSILKYIWYHKFIILSANHVEIKPPRMSQKLTCGSYILLQQCFYVSASAITLIFTDTELNTSIKNGIVPSVKPCPMMTFSEHT